MKNLFTLLYLFFACTLFSQNNVHDNVINDTLLVDFKLFSKDIPLNLSLKSDFTKFRKEKEAGKYQEAELTYILDDGTIITNQVKIKARGNNRRENCFFPPIAINFKNETNKDLQADFYKLKMVVHCKEHKIYEKYLLKEYLCYKLYNCLETNSFSVRLLEMNYHDTGRKKQKITQMFAFIIEDEKMMAERLDAVLDKSENLTQKSVNQENIMQLAMFQFMIGNFDWAVPTQQNLKLIRPNSSVNHLLAIPYDFDYCGLVDANYAIPNEALGISSVQQRLYLGECKPEETLKPVIEKFMATKSKFYKEIEQFKYLDIKDKSSMIKYLDQFYEMIEKKGFYKNYIERTCKKIGKKE